MAESELRSPKLGRFLWVWTDLETLRAMVFAPSARRLRRERVSVSSAPEIDLSSSNEASGRPSSGVLLFLGRSRTWCCWSSCCWMSWTLELRQSGREPSGDEESAAVEEDEANREPEVVEWEVLGLNESDLLGCMASRRERGDGTGWCKKRSHAEGRLYSGAVQRQVF